MRCHLVVVNLIVIANMKQEQALGILRHVLTFVGGVLMAKGVVTDGWVADTVGAIMTLTGSVWSLLDKNK